MKIKTFPIQFTEEYLEKIRAKAYFQGKTVKAFILEAIEEKMNKGE